MKPCSKCGFELFDYAQRCSNCGLKDPHNIGYDFSKGKEVVTETPLKSTNKKVGRPLAGEFRQCRTCGKDIYVRKYRLKDNGNLCKECSVKELPEYARLPRPRKKGSGRTVGRRNYRTQKLIPKVSELRDQGGSLRQISKETGLAKSTVRSMVPPSDKHITPKARSVLDKCLAHSLTLFTKQYYNNLGGDRDKLDAFMETQCELIEPTELTNQMVTWACQLDNIGDNGFVRGAIYALNKMWDYFSSIKKLEPPDNPSD